jgi:hypothetical protein
MAKKAKKPANAGIQFEADFIATARAAGFMTEKLSTPTPPGAFRCTCGAARSTFTTKRPYDVLLAVPSRSTAEGLYTFWLIAVECKSSGASPRLELDRIQSHQIKGLQDRAKAGWKAGLAIDLPKPAATGEREWWWLPAHLIEQMVAACEAAERKSATWKEIRDAGGTQIGQGVLEFMASLGVY